MWKRSDVDDNKQYQIAFYQSKDGYRYFCLHEVGETTNKEFFVLLTHIVPNELLKGSMDGIAKSITFTNGEHFYFDDYGIWITQDEMQVIMADKDDLEIPWLNGLAPHFAPK